MAEYFEHFDLFTAEVPKILRDQASGNYTRLGCSVRAFHGTVMILK